MRPRNDNHSDHEQNKQCPNLSSEKPSGLLSLIAIGMEERWVRYLRKVGILTRRWYSLVTPGCIESMRKTRCSLGLKERHVKRDEDSGEIPPQTSVCLNGLASLRVREYVS